MRPSLPPPSFAADSTENTLLSIIFSWFRHALPLTTAYAAASITGARFKFIAQATSCRRWLLRATSSSWRWTARGRRVEPLLPALQRLVPLRLVCDPVIDPPCGQLFPQRFAVVHIVGVVSRFVAQDRCFSGLAVVQIRQGHRRGG